MNRVKRLGITLAVVISLFLVFSQAVYASIDVGTSNQASYSYYIGAGTFSMIMQVLIGSLVGVAAMIGVYKTRVKNFFTRRRHDKESGEAEDSEKKE